jgi:S-formylglutathione hydrolase FrmB
MIKFGESSSGSHIEKNNNIFPQKVLNNISVFSVVQFLKLSIIKEYDMNYPQYSVFLWVLLFISGRSDIQNKNEISKTLGHIGLDAIAATEVKFYSEAVQRNMVINVLLPRDYEKSDLRYPVLYLCHGLTSNYNEFKYVGVPEYLNRFDMIVVMVDVGNSWYVNWAISEEGWHNNFADHVCVDVINYVDKNYRTIAERKGRAINGISMGGFGAISLGLSHPDLFCSIASHSGALGWARRQREILQRGKKPWVIWDQAYEDTVTRYRGIDVEGYSTLKDRTPKGQPFVKQEEIDVVDPFTLVLKIPIDKLPHIYLDCGLEDRLISAAREFMQLMVDNDIPFQYGQSAGKHEEDYWGRETSVSMAVQYAVMLRNIWGKEFEIYDAYKK